MEYPRISVNLSRISTALGTLAHEWAGEDMSKQTLITAAKKAREQLDQQIAAMSAEARKE